MAQPKLGRVPDEEGVGGGEGIGIGIVWIGLVMVSGTVWRQVLLPLV